MFVQTQPWIVSQQVSESPLSIPSQTFSIANRTLTGLSLIKHSRLSAESLSGTSLTTKGYVDRLETGFSAAHDLQAVVRRRLPLPDDPPISKGQAMTDSGRQFYVYTLDLTVKEPSEWEPDSPQAPAGASPSLSSGSLTSQRSMREDLAGMGSFW